MRLLAPIFALDSVVVKLQKLLCAHGGIHQRTESVVSKFSGKIKTSLTIKQ